MDAKTAGTQRSRVAGIILRGGTTSINVSLALRKNSSPEDARSKFEACEYIIDSDRPKDLVSITAGLSFATRVLSGAPVGYSATFADTALIPARAVLSTIETHVAALTFDKLSESRDNVAKRLRDCIPGASGELIRAPLSSENVSLPSPSSSSSSSANQESALAWTETTGRGGFVAVCKAVDPDAAAKAGLGLYCVVACASETPLAEEVAGAIIGNVGHGSMDDGSTVANFSPGCGETLYNYVRSEKYSRFGALMGQCAARLLTDGVAAIADRSCIMYHPELSGSSSSLSAARTSATAASGGARTTDVDPRDASFGVCESLLACARAPLMLVRPQFEMVVDSFRADEKTRTVTYDCGMASTATACGGIIVACGGPDRSAMRFSIKPFDDSSTVAQSTPDQSSSSSSSSSSSASKARDCWFHKGYGRAAESDAFSLSYPPGIGGIVYETFALV